MSDYRADAEGQNGREAAIGDDDTVTPALGATVAVVARRRVGPAKQHLLASEGLLLESRDSVRVYKKMRRFGIE